MSYFFDANEEVEFKRMDGHLYLFVIHRDHSHDGMKPHAHILDITNLTLEQSEVERDLNRYMGEAKEYGRVISYT